MQTTDPVLRMELGNAYPASLARTLRDRGVPAEHRRITRDDFDGDFDDWQPGEYVFVSHDTAAAWRAARSSAPSDPVEHFDFLIEAVATPR